MKQFLELTRKDLEAFKAGDKVTYNHETFTVGRNQTPKEPWIYFISDMRSKPSPQRTFHIRYGSEGYAAASASEWYSFILNKMQFTVS